MHPRARTKDLTVRELPDETMVYDLITHRAHCLNPVSTLLWKHCDGRHDEAALEALLGREFGLGGVEARAAVRLALEQLSRRHLLEQPVGPSRARERVTRREALRKIAVTAAAALPLVMTLRSPSVAWAQSATGCTTSLECPSNNPCQVGFCSGAGQTGPHFSKSVKGTCGLLPVVDGTSCGPGMVCKGGNCVSKTGPCKQSGQACTGSGQGNCCAGCDCLGGACSC